MLERERTQGDLKLRSKQAVLHLALTEERIAQLEAELRNLQAELHNKPDGLELNRFKKQCLVYRSILEPLTYGSFRSRSMRHRTDVPPSERPSMEILVTEHLHGTPRAIDDCHSPKGSLQRTNQRTPERLRIRYVPLIKTLERICSETLSNQEVWGVPIKPGTGAPTVLLRPWKLFVAYEREIRSSVHEVEALLDAARHKKENGGAIGKGDCEGCKQFESLGRFTFSGSYRETHQACADAVLGSRRIRIRGFAS